jgi:hypothetical protein
MCKLGLWSRLRTPAGLIPSASVSMIQVTCHLCDWKTQEVILLCLPAWWAVQSNLQQGPDNVSRHYGNLAEKSRHHGSLAEKFFGPGRLPPAGTTVWGLRLPSGSRSASRSLRRTGVPGPSAKEQTRQT